jgi:hypothetical protein
MGSDGNAAADESSCSEAKLSGIKPCAATANCVGAVAVVEATLEVELASLSGGASWTAGDTLPTEVAAFQEKFVGEVASALGVPADRVQIVEMRSGSVVVLFKILPTADTTAPAPATLATQLRALVADDTSTLHSGEVFSNLAGGSAGLAVVESGAVATPQTGTRPGEEIKIPNDDELSKPIFFVCIVGVALLAGAAMFAFGWRLRGRKSAAANAAALGRTDSRAELKAGMVLLPGDARGEIRVPSRARENSPRGQRQLSPVAVSRTKSPGRTRPSPSKPVRDHASYRGSDNV